jgi:hypothetical protein
MNEHAALRRMVLDIEYAQRLPRREQGGRRILIQSLGFRVPPSNESDLRIFECVVLLTTRSYDADICYSIMKHGV